MLTTLVLVSYTIPNEYIGRITLEEYKKPLHKWVHKLWQMSTCVLNESKNTKTPCISFLLCTKWSNEYMDEKISMNTKMPGISFLLCTKWACKQYNSTDTKIFDCVFYTVTSKHIGSTTRKTRKYLAYACYTVPNEFIGSTSLNEDNITFHMFSKL